LHVGDIYIEQKEWDEASQVYLKVLTLSPEWKEEAKVREMLREIEEKSEKKGEKKD